MSTLQLPMALDLRQPPKAASFSALASSFWARKISYHFAGDGISLGSTKRRRFDVVLAMASSPAPSFKINLNEYLVTLEKPLGIRFALSVDGRIFVHALKKGGNAEKSRIVMVGDTLKKASDSSDKELIEIKNFGDAEKMLKARSGSFSLVLERPFSPFPIQRLLQLNDLSDNSFSKGKVPIATWRKASLSTNLQGEPESNGSSGFVTFSPKFLNSQGWKLLNEQNGDFRSLAPKNSDLSMMNELVCVFSEDESGDGEWAHGNFPLEEYVKALERSEGELSYNHSLGMRYSKITEQIYVGSCIQTESDVETLSNDLGITAVLNFQGGVEAENWGLDPELINESCQKFGILMINYPIRDGDSFDMRKKLPFCVGLLLRLLKKNYRVYITCTTGFDRAPACVVAYLHWITDTSLHLAYNFVTGLHACKPDRPAIAWATWDLIAMVENGKHEGAPTHAVTFVWNGQEGEDVNLVGDFTGNWKDKMRANHKGGSRFEAETRLSHGKYYYKFIVNGQWRHSTSSPSERDESGNVNNVIVIGDIASVVPSVHMQQQKRDANIVKVIERPLSETERFLLAKAARCIAFSVCPIRLSPK